MKDELIRPVLSGVFGAIVAALLSRVLSKWIPTVYREKSSENLIREHRIEIRVSNGLLFLGLLGSLALYQIAGFAHNDWRPFCLGFGFALSAPLVAIPAISFAAGRSPREAYVAFAISQRFPPVVIYGILIAGMAMFFVAVSSFWC